MRLYELQSPILEWSRDQLANVSGKQAFVSWFGNSKVVDKNGLPMPCYHFTHNDFSESEFRSFSHFGTWQAAQQRWLDTLDYYVRQNRKPTRYKDYTPDMTMDQSFQNDQSLAWTGYRDVIRRNRTIPVFLKIENPIRIIDHGDAHSTAFFAALLYRMKLASREELAEIGFRPCLASTYDAEISDLVRRGCAYRGPDINPDDVVPFYRRAGYDGFVYRNKVEHKRSTSWITLEPTQVKPVLDFFGE